jgi:hypothetical protein
VVNRVLGFYRNDQPPPFCDGMCRVKSYWKAIRAVFSGCALLLALCARADQGLHDVQSASFFRRAAVEDVEAAWRLLRDNHPGAAAELGDTDFLRNLQIAVTTARDRAKRVSTLEGYLAVMTGFDSNFGDRHVRAVPMFNISRPDWVGLIMGLRGTEWMVVDEDPWPDRPSLLGAHLLSCDNRTATAIAKERLGGFRGTWDIVAQRGLAAPWLLIDEHNPFVEQLRQCTFGTGTGEVTIPMTWTPIARDAIISRIQKAGGSGAAGYGLRRAGNGWWIAIQEFTGNAPAVVASAQEQASELVSAPFVVLDVRGNGGGSSAIGDDLAAILYGSAARQLSDSDDACPEAWRASPGNIARLESYPALLGSRLSTEANLRIRTDIEAMRKAIAAGRVFSRPVDCGRPTHAPRVSATNGPRIFVLTDRVCFSSCLIVVNHFLKLGATQIGEETNADTRYQENRREILPSGLAMFGVQTAVSPGEPQRVGPFVPRYVFNGDLTDTPAVERWVVENAASWVATR